ncbi:DUF4383 domain-containing protein [Actinokineospora sp. UTMC 2448]|uniref:DUF4383 domain-containing protein n=1 Tax=Actinokineospora sp. UTMC 2448 TaxID=2268449 RepID=UPI0021641FEE|nr:DUF4383 domain-containing protein [Actinokineospora sp. UTMC 2448]UVS79283.1 hypothetical protein Actkin_03030 [Actinokineospora sp. UTMC 2448]
MRNGRGTGARVLCGLLGAALLTFGIIGLAQIGLSGFAPVPEGTADRTDVSFGGSTLLSVIHLIMGALALFAALRNGARMAGLFGMIAFAGLLAYDIVALIADDPDDPLGARWPVLVLHALGLLACVLMVALANRATHDFEGEQH